MPVFACRIAVALYVSDKFGIRLTCSVETEAGFNLLVLEVTVNGFGTSNNLYTIVFFCILFSKYTCIGVGIVASNDDESFDSEFAKDFNTAFELLFLFEFCASASDDVKASCVAVFID